MIRPLPPGWTRPVVDEVTDELREALASTLWLAQPEYFVAQWDEISGLTREQYRKKADALLAGPLAPLLAKVRAVEALTDDYDRCGDIDLHPSGVAEQIRAALVTEP